MHQGKKPFSLYMVCINGYTGQTGANILNSNVLIAPGSGSGRIYDKNYIYLENNARATEGTGTYVNKQFATSADADADAANYYFPKGGSAMGTAGYRKN